MSLERVLTIWPEWVYAILHLGKDVELRTWRYSPSRVGAQVILHAGAYVGGPGPKEEGRANVRHFIHRVHEITGSAPPAGWAKTAKMLAGRPAAVATLGEPTLSSASPWASVDGDVWAWPLTDVRQLPDDMPVVRGDRGLWLAPPWLSSLCRERMT